MRMRFLIAVLGFGLSSVACIRTDSLYPLVLAEDSRLDESLVGTWVEVRQGKRNDDGEQYFVVEAASEHEYRITFISGGDEEKPIVLMARRQILGGKEYVDVHVDEEQITLLKDPALVFSRSFHAFARIQRNEDGLLVQVLDGQVLGELVEVGESAEWNGLRLTRPGEHDILLISGTSALQKFFASRHADKVLMPGMLVRKK